MQPQILCLRDSLKVIIMFVLFTSVGHVWEQMMDAFIVKLLGVFPFLLAAGFIVEWTRKGLGGTSSYWRWLWWPRSFRFLLIFLKCLASKLKVWEFKQIELNSCSVFVMYERNWIPRRSEWKLLSTMQQWFLSNTIGRYSCNPVSAHLMIAWN